MDTTTNIDPFSPEADRIIAEGQTAVERAQAMITAIKQSRESQPERLAKARAEAETAADWSQIEEPFAQHVTALRTDGDPLSSTIALPSMQAKCMYGVRLAFDALDAGEDSDRLDKVKSDLFTMVDGDTGLAFLIFAEALDTIASLVVPQLLTDLEQHGSNYDARVTLAEARVKAWADRVGNHSAALDLGGG